MNSTFFLCTILEFLLRTSIGFSHTRYSFFFHAWQRGSRYEFSHQLSVQKFRQVQATVLHFFPLSFFLYVLIQYIPRTHTRTHRKSVVCIFLQCNCRYNYNYIIIHGIARDAIDLPFYLENNLLRIRHDSNKYHT